MRWRCHSRYEQRSDVKRKKLVLERRAMALAHENRTSPASRSSIVSRRVPNDTVRR
jgi:hypothetical protein